MNNKASIPDKKQYYIDIAVILLICLVFFAFLELRYPYFFLNDDNADSYLCSYRHTVRSVLSGEFPFYNFHQFCGKRFFEVGQTGSLNPLVYIAAFCSQIIFGHFDATIDIIALVLIAIGSVGAYVFLREIGCTRIPAIIGAIGWNLNSYNICIGNSWIIVIMTTSLLPWMYYGSFKFHQRRSVSGLLLAIIPRIALFYCGHPQFFIYSVLFDFVYLAAYVLLSNSGAGTRLRSLLNLIVEYIVSYVIVTIASLPLLLPMLDFMSTSERSEKISFEAFISSRLISGVGFFGIVSIVFTGVGTVILIFLTVSLGKGFAAYRKETIGMLAALPVAVITLLWMLSVNFNRIIYLIPILNRFRWPHKLTIVTISAVIIISSLAMTMLERYLKQKHGKSLHPVFITLLALQIISLLCLYMFSPHKTAGIITSSEVPYEEGFADGLSTERYVSVCFNPVSIDEASTLQVIDTTSTLEYDLATYYGFNSISGYYGVMMRDDVKEYAEFFSHIHDLSGEMPELYSGLVEEMRGQSVRWYVTDINNKSAVADYLTPYGITQVYEDDKKAVFEDAYCEPLAFDDAGSEISLEQKVNSLELITPSDYEGGSICVNYAYDEYFICTIDGEPTNITPGANRWDFSIVCPPGEHHITIRYVERYFVPAMIISVFGIAIVVILLTLYVRKGKRPELNQNRNNRIS